jgi:broad specificity phosphatase PhoE
LQRAHATAAAIASHHGLAVEIDERLIELDYGDWDGLPLHEVGAESWAAWQRDVAFTPPGGESLEDVARRVAGFMESELDDAPTVTVAVSHVSPIKAAVCDALEVGIEVSWRMQLGVASITRIAGRDGRGVLLSYNETSHLTPT